MGQTGHSWCGRTVDSALRISGGRLSPGISARACAGPQAIAVPCHSFDRIVDYSRRALGKIQIAAKSNVREASSD